MIKIAPSPVRKAPGDYVSYKFTDDLNKTQLAKNEPCYSSMGLISNNKILENFTLEVGCNYHKSHHLSNEIYKSWFELCIKHNIMSDKVQITYTEDGPQFSIERGTIQGNDILCSLCCHRWADSNASLVWAAVQYCSALEDTVDFWQIFHYVSSTNITNSNHSFLSLGGYVAATKEEDLSETIAAKIYFNNKGAYNSSKVSHIIYRIQQKLRPVVVMQDDVLNPKWKPLYNLENPTSKSIGDLVAQIKRNKNENS